MTTVGPPSMNKVLFVACLPGTASISLRSPANVSLEGLTKRLPVSEILECNNLSLLPGRTNVALAFLRKRRLLITRKHADSFFSPRVLIIALRMFVSMLSSVNLIVQASL